MKKLLFFILFIPICVFASDSNNFTVDIPEDMIEVDTNSNYYKWIYKDKELPSITVIQEENKNYNIDLFDEEDILNYENYIENELNNEMKEYDINIDVYDSEIISINERNSLVYYTKWDTMDSYGYDTYQKIFVFTTKSYLSTVTFSAKSEEEISSELFNNVIDSFVINDEDIIIENNTDKFIIMFAIIGALLGFILSLIIFKKRRK